MFLVASGLLLYAEQTQTLSVQKWKMYWFGFGKFHRLLAKSPDSVKQKWEPSKMQRKGEPNA